MTLQEFSCPILNEHKQGPIELKVTVQLVEIQRQRSNGRGGFLKPYNEQVSTSVACDEYNKHERKCKISRKECIYLSAFPRQF